jgi:hypothetical protein
MSNANPTPAATYLELIATPDLPAVGPEPRPSRWPAAELRAKVEGWCARQPAPAVAGALLQSAALLWHDHLEPCHALARQIPTPEGNFLHGIMHRRQPDVVNAKNCFHRVGRHACFATIARQTTASLAKAEGRVWLARIVPNGLWDPFAFIDACAEAIAQGPAAPAYGWLQTVQRIEFEALVGSFWQGRE